MQSAAKKIDYIFCGKFRHLSRFSMVGALNTIIDFLVFTVFYEVFGIDYIISQITGYSFGILNSFILNKKWTFSENNSGKKRLFEFIQFIAVNFITLGVTLIAMKFLVQSININLYASKVIVTFIAQITNFTLYKFWVFY